MSLSHASRRSALLHFLTITAIRPLVLQLSSGGLQITQHYAQLQVCGLKYQVFISNY